jgi:predicted nuclease of restriction endonuclease-like (RecB) superfamily
MADERMSSEGVNVEIAIDLIEKRTKIIKDILQLNKLYPPDILKDPFVLDRHTMLNTLAEKDLEFLTSIKSILQT